MILLNDVRGRCRLKMAALKTSTPFLLALLLGNAEATWNISLDADLRYEMSDYTTHEGGVHALGASVRKTFSDHTGDRFIIFGLFETEDNFSEHMIHELYFRYKGPLGSWNITAGRFGLPYGLLTTFSTSRLLYQSASYGSLGLDADNGVMVSGVIGMADYALALTQGYGAHRMPEFPGHGILTARFGLTFGDAEEYSVGVSGAAGKTESGHHRHHVTEKYLGGADATIAWGLANIRLEGNGGVVDGKQFFSAFAGIDYPLLPGVELTTSALGSLHGHEKFDSWFVGLSFKPNWFTLRGGYTYAHFNAPKHTFSVQLYRLFSFTL